MWTCTHGIGHEHSGPCCCPTPVTPNTSGRSSCVDAPDPAAVMAAHEGDHWCTTFDEGNGPGRTVLFDVDGPCEPYRLAEALLKMTRRAEKAEQAWGQEAAFHTRKAEALAAEQRLRDYLRQDVDYWSTRAETAEQSLAAEQAKVARVVAELHHARDNGHEVSGQGFVRPVPGVAISYVESALADQPKGNPDRT